MKPYYEENGMTIYHGDCREILPSLPRVDLVLTDPPYNVGLDYCEGDNMQDFEGWILPIVNRLREISPLVLLTPGIRNLWTYPKADWVFAWAKPGSTRRSDLGGFNEWEPALLYGKRKVYHDLDYLPSVSSLNASSYGHPCPKPIKLFKSYIGKLTEPDQVVLDPFMGSGTTLRAAKDLGRKAIGIEIEERYCEIAANRLRQEVLAFA